MRLILVAACCALLFALPVAGTSRWGVSDCTVAQEPVGPARVQNGYQWKTLPDDATRAYLWLNGKQIGGWDATRQKYRPLLNWNENLWGGEQDAAPIPPPSNMVRPVDGVKPKPDPSPTPASPTEQAEKVFGKIEVWQLQGVNVNELCKHQRHSINGRAVAESDGMNAISKGVLPDDSGKLWLSVWSRDPAKRAAVVSDLMRDPELAKWVNERCHVWAGDAAHPEHFLTRDRAGQLLYAFDGDPVISLQAPDGVELWHDAGYTQGPSSLQMMRKRDPNYKPDNTPGPKKPVGPDKPDTVSSADGFGPYALIAAMGLGLLLWPRKETPQ